MKKIYLLLIGFCFIINFEARGSKTLEITSGNLSLLLTEEEKDTITSLTLTGTVDARDFITISQMPLLTELDLTQTSITAITLSNYGTFLANTIGTYGVNPSEANSLFSSRLTSLKLPSTLKTIGTAGLKNCRGLTSIEIPPSVTAIGYYAFEGCYGLTSLNIPSSVIYIEDFAFMGCCGLKELIISPSINIINEHTFALCSGLTSLTIPPSVIYIDDSAFMDCTGLTSVVLPKSFIGLSCAAFMDCPNITSIYSYNPFPPELRHGAFSGIDISISKIYVPSGAVALYAATEGWDDFINIVEMEGFSLSANTLTLGAKENSSATVELHGTISWNASSDQEWLTVSPASGNSTQILTFTPKANLMDTTRIAIVTVSLYGGDSQTIIVTQQGMPVGLDEMAKGAQIKCYPNPFTTELTIEVANPSHKEVSVDIFTMTGQKVKGLVRGQKEDKISCSWNGLDEKGQKSPDGIYILKMNEVAKKVVFEGR